jgi:EGF domain-specific O-GlcNAc transferase
MIHTGFFQIYGCENSALFNAFSEHILHRLQIKPNLPDKNKKLRISFLARETKYRKVLNEDELIERIKTNPKYSVKRVDYGRNISFKDQLRITRNSDIFIGMHGAGLTHLLFLPKWATLFELYHCEDPNCYKDLARLRGVNYVTWENNTLLESIDAGYEGGEHEKFKNYKFDVDEFERLVEKAAEAVLENPDYIEYLGKLHHDEL